MEYFRIPIVLKLIFYSKKYRFWQYLRGRCMMDRNKHRENNQCNIPNKISPN